MSYIYILDKLFRTGAQNSETALAEGQIIIMLWAVIKNWFKLIPCRPQAASGVSCRVTVCRTANHGCPTVPTRCCRAGHRPAERGGDTGTSGKYHFDLVRSPNDPKKSDFIFWKKGSELCMEKDLKGLPVGLSSDLGLIFLDFIFRWKEFHAALRLRLASFQNPVFSASKKDKVQQVVIPK